MSYILSDSLVLTLAWCVAAVGRHAFHGEYAISWYLRLWPMLIVFIVTFATRGLYMETGLSPVEEFRRLTVSTSMVFTSLIVFTFLVHEAEAYSRLVFVMAWALTVILLPINRAAVRKLAGQKTWWGTTAVILGAGAGARAILRTLHNDPTLGIRVKALFGDVLQGSVDGIPIVGTLEQVPHLARRTRVQTAIIPLPDLAGVSLSDIVARYGKYFSQLLIVPDTRGLTNLCVEAHGLGHLMTIRIRQNLLRRWPRLCKRIFDLVLALVCGVLALPVVLVAAIAVRLTSCGPVFFGHIRIGKDERLFKAWKFRTMILNADQVLAAHLARDPLLRQEWEESRKLRNDPRVTSIGRLLRKLSIDELPQLWNVLRGEMSLIGPRPIVRDEVARYADRFEIYTRVLPGISGLWQVSGRNDMDFDHRVDLDTYYVHNWSPWLDVYVLARTVRAVIQGKGAY